MFLNHPLFQTLRELRGNPRASVLTEIMFGIPYNLFMPFFSVYMLGLGVTDQQIGTIASLGLVVQIFSALLSGAIVDKFGRRLTLFVCDLLSWSMPCLIWAVAQDVQFFVAAALMNSLFRISHTAWTCLMVITSIYNTVSSNFWGVLFTGKLGFPEAQISIYAAIRSIIMTVCFFLIGPRLTNLRRFRLPLWAGFGAALLSQFLLVVMPPQTAVLLVISIVLEGIAGALVSPMTESLLAASMESAERARVSAMVYVALIVLISPFGWVAGQLSAIDRALPFALNTVLFAIGLGLVWFFGRPGFLHFANRPATSEPAEPALLQAES